MALVTAAEVRELLPDLSGTGEDTLIETFIGAADELAARVCGYPPATANATPTLESATYVRYFDPSRCVLDCDRRRLVLGFTSITSITSIYDDPDQAYDADHLVDSGDYDLDGQRAAVLTPDALHAWSTRGARAIKATFVAGFSTAPPLLKLAIRTIVQDLYHGRNTPLPGARVDPKRAGMRSEAAHYLARYHLPPLYRGAV